MDSKTYIAKKSKRELRGILTHLERQVSKGLTADTVPQAEVDAQLRKAFGIPGGTETKEQREMMTKVLRLASWNGKEDSSEVEGFANLKEVNRLLGKEPPKLWQIAKRVTTKIVKEHIAPEMVDEHGGFKDIATGAVVDALFVDGPRIDIKSAREEYFARLAEELLAIMGK